MNVKELNVLIDRSVKVSEASDVLGRAGVDIRGFSVSDTAEHGHVRFIVDAPDRGAAALAEAGFPVEVNDVLCVALSDAPGGLAAVLQVVSDAGVAIQHVYSLLSPQVVLDVADVDRAITLLAGKPLQLLSQEELARA